MGGSSQPATTTQIQKTELPAWVEKASQDNYGFATEVANRPFEQYQGQTVAPLSAGEKAASGILGAGMTGGSALQDAAASMLGRAGAYQPGQVATGASMQSVAMPQGVGNVGTMAPAANVGAPNGFLAVNAPGAVANVANASGATPIGPVQGVANVSAQRFNGGDLSSYLNPYTSNVVDTTLSGMRDNLALSAQKTDDAARASGAWGSSRSGVQQAVLASQGAKDMAATEAGLRSAAYTDAAGRQMQDNASALQAALANQATASTTQGRQLQADQSNQSSALTTQALNADIGKANQASALQTAQQGLAAQTTNASNWLSNSAAALDAAKANQASTNTNNALNAGILQGNQAARQQTEAQRLQAGVANQGAYGTALSQALDAQKANQSAGLAAANLGLGAGTALGQLGNDVTNNAGKNALLSAQLGANDRAVQQANLDASASKWQEAYDAPLTALNTRLAALGMSPYGKTTTTNETKSGGTSSNTGLQVLGGAMSLLPLMFSDEQLKKNVRTEGTTDAGVPLKSWEYKGFMAKDAPGRHIGVMAQELERVDPGAVHKVKARDGKTYRAVDYSRVGRGFMGRAAA